MHSKSVAELSAGLARREFSSEELARAYLERVRALDPGLNAFITVTGDRAIERARSADRVIAAGEQGPLTGIPVAYKDLYCTRGVKTSCGSRMLDNFVAPYDATAIARLEGAGMVPLGKTNMDEFAMGSSNENSYYGPVKNPWDHSRVPGGSSGGSAAAVAARLTPVATGTDTGGSIRQPAALCGVTGLKPTYGRVSRYGMIAFASSLDQGGLLARSAEDVALALAAMAGHDDRDSTSIDRPVDDYAGALGRELDGIRIGLPRQHLGEGLEAGVGRAIEEAIKVFEGLGATVREVDLPNAHLAIPAYYVIALAECSSNLSRFDGVRFGYRTPRPADLEALYKDSRAEGFGAEVKRRIMVGTYALSAGYYDAYYLQAQKVRRLICEDFRTAFDEVDVLMGPTSPTVAFELGEKTDNPVDMYLSDIYTVAVNLAGLCGISVPAGLAGGLPVGLQIVAGHFQEARLLNLAHRFQEVTDWHRRLPPGVE